MYSTLSLREINRYLSKDLKLESTTKKKNIKAILLSKYKNADWNKAGYKLHYNFYKINQLLGFDIEYILENKKAYIIIEDIRIPIKKQDYFHYIFVNELKKYKITRNWFDEFDLLDEDILSIEVRVNTTNKGYRTDMEIKVTDTHYICVEFFEMKHANFNDLTLEVEKSRIYKLLHDINEEKRYMHFAIYWESKLTDNEYLSEFVKSLVRKIKDYKHIDDERYWCINAINEYVKNKELSKDLYDGYLNKNEPIFTVQKLSDIGLIQWKDKNSMTLYFEKFRSIINKLKQKEELVKFDDDYLDFLEENNSKKSNKIYYINDKLTYYGFMSYINRIPDKYLKNEEDDKEELINLFQNISHGFISGIQKRFKLLENINEQLIYGLNDFRN
jgi:hypothetical protein